MSKLPNGWVSASLADCADFNPRHPDDVARSTLVSFVPMPAVDEHTGEIKGHSVRPLAEVWRGYTHFRESDVIVAKITPCMENGKAAVARTLESGLACGSTEFHVLRPIEGISPDFLWRYVRQKTFREEAEQSMTGAVGQRRVPVKFLKQCKLSLPPAPEQRRITAKIDSLSARSNRARDELNRVPKLFLKYRSAVLDSALTGRMTSEWRSAHPNEQWSRQDIIKIEALHSKYLRTRRGSRLHSAKGTVTPELPRGWVAAHLAEAGTLQVGYAYKSAWYSREGIRLLRGANVSPGRITWDDEERLSPEMAAQFEDYRLNVGDMVIAMDRPVISTGLKVAVIGADDAGSLLVQRVARYVPGEFVVPKFAWYLINSHIFLDHAVSQAAGSDLPHISSNDILTTPLPLPPLREQHEIVRRIEAAFAWIDRLAAEATSARKLIDRLDQTVLAKAFRGELVPQDLSDEPASVLLERINAVRGGAVPRGKRRGRPSKAVLL